MVSSMCSFCVLHPLMLYAIAIAVLLSVMLALASVTGNRRVGPARGASMNLPFESGILPVGSAHLRLPVQYYLIAVFFVIFDAEAVFLFSWATVARQAGWQGYAAVLLFLGFLAIALAYLWRSGGLEWGPTQRLTRKVL
ncbi:NADH-quinone oxidoreductase subunit A [Gluconacetobacter liquefaciens]|uniref:NADH-quinone oxidoreductase subunit A n=2 Tax=Gluconacetobacter liquefaciens TaxID=89584 RepID=A0A370G1K5_GLULI|nr:NADH dehydrogenase subunit A [Gluconacetobacter liquefaciens]GBQ94012.1 NADH-quinone oxidoreductase subunit A [Gluconacetobacter liquefaciens NRIC 0522]GEB37857.1 NADH-quinone oxidoreductase subunit A [Gluconacetobacter liquefaciens]